jgi:pterin-4a-carbinolamine dehydratase
MLSDEEIRKHITDLDNAWELKDGKIVKSFQFSSFINAIEFVNTLSFSVRKSIYSVLTYQISYFF